jgi:glycosyltransferase involved in cell wall biosynthesis
MVDTVSVVIPAKNEVAAIAQLIFTVREQLPDAEVIVVDDGSTDDTAQVAIANGAKVISQKYSMGNGAAIKAGARHAAGDIIVFMDGDGQHDPKDIQPLLKMLGEGYDMVVGARSRASQASHQRAIANSLYNRLASFMVGQKVHDLTSGFRAIRRKVFCRYLYLLPNKFSYPTTITMALFRAGYNVGYLPIIAKARVGTSHIKLFRDGVRFLIIIFKIGTLYSPLKVFAPVSALLFLVGVGNYAKTYFEYGRFTNMSAFLMIVAVTIFLMGLVSEQITTLMYRDSD